MLKVSGKYRFGLEFARFQAKNYDQTTPTPTRTVGGAGPFDLSGAGVTIAAIPMTIKLDNGSAVTKSIDLTAAAVPAAVTVDEIVTACSAASFTGISFSKEAVTGYLLVKQTVVTAAVMQVYGQMAELALIGQGRGTKFVKCDSLKDFTSTQTEKASETIATTDAQGGDTEMISDSYVKGGTGKFTDTAYDQELLALIEGGSLVSGKYSAPLPSAQKVYWGVEYFQKIFAYGSNKQGNVIGYIRIFIDSASGSSPDAAAARAFSEAAYNFIATEGVDASGAKLAWRTQETLSVAQYSALNLAAV